MKNIFFSLFLIIFLIIPLSVKAVQIGETTIIAEDQKNIGEDLHLGVKINFDGLEKGNDKSLGIWFISFELKFDDSVFQPTSIVSKNFNSEIYKDEETNKYYVLSEVIENNSSDSSCADGLLYCGDYLVNIVFFIKDTKLTTSTLEIGEIEIGLLDIVDENKTYTVDDLIEVSSISNKTHTITINDNIKSTITPQKDITTTNKQESPIKAPIELQSETKSSNNFLSMLEIENYDIDFDREKKEYTIYIDENTNSLNIKATLDDSKASYNVIGEDNLKANNYKVKIEVISEDNTKNTYTITTKLKEENTLKKEKEVKNLNKDIITYIGISVGIIILVIIMLLLVNKRKNKQIDKYLDKL